MISTFNIAYIDYDREKGKTKTVAGNIFLAKDGSLNFDKVDITAAKRTVLPLSRSGATIMLAEYNSKEKTLVWNW
ncbi:MAG: hypothetical protein IPK76_05430 [Lewinellaceae bacterium]|nr:hypothetical protein [Lewinellaceae bacterium]